MYMNRVNGDLDAGSNACGRITDDNQRCRAAVRPVWALAIISQRPCKFANYSSFSPRFCCSARSERMQGFCGVSSGASIPDAQRHSSLHSLYNFSQLSRCFMKTNIAIFF